MEKKKPFSIILIRTLGKIERNQARVENYTVLFILKSLCFFCSSLILPSSPFAPWVLVSRLHSLRTGSCIIIEQFKTINDEKKTKTHTFAHILYVCLVCFLSFMEFWQSFVCANSSSEIINKFPFPSRFCSLSNAINVVPYWNCVPSVFRSYFIFGLKFFFRIFLYHSRYVRFFSKYAGLSLWRERAPSPQTDECKNWWIKENMWLFRSYYLPICSNHVNMKLQRKCFYFFGKITCKSKLYYN